ncbi:GNAT family N-acetyltransferase [Bacillus aquiflavi]|uniref:GNAT family N-acetyltransferase n=1 Tax=Bacillus aquiflavi TaxID=2672567 RepID=A0A6B3VQT4_9BACI|nr:GNAT family N-acetyltransferase [Bacillus aquiflavi]MBA4535944.1 GNAT family N-acetyltransferase [Bacillus aquiflavi]NEY80319.1 GNAT family N-acetyltransferase [Bacillus aquiflavi]UAC49816.1 GNAT family N-acetyltransferase [Bacillus aquiflavi]
MAENYRLATLNDAENLLQLTLRAYEPIRELDLKFPAATANIDLVQQNIDKNACYLLEVDGELVATITIQFPWGDNSVKLDIPYIWWFAVDPGWGKQGFGSKLLAWTELYIRDNLKAPAVSLATSDRHPWLVAMYERKGYERAFEKDFGKDGKVVYLKKVLRPKAIQQQLIKE